MQIFFNGIPQNLDNFNGTENISFVFQSGENGASFSPELTLTGAAFDYAYAQLINVPAPGLSEMFVDVYDECCLNPDGSPVHLFSGVVRGANVTWCTVTNGASQCEMNVTVVDNSQDARAVECLKNVFPWDRKLNFQGTAVTSGEDTFRAAPYLTYCIDVRPGFFQEIVFILGILMLFGLSPVIVFVSLIGVITGLIPNFGFFFSELQRLLVGCGYKHKTPFVHSYMRNMCELCGLNLSSSLFEPGGDYHNTMRLDAPYKPGRKIASRIIAAYDFNKPNLNGVQFLDELKQFNFDWKIQGSALVIERKDQFGAGVYVDLTTLPETEILSLCFDTLAERPKAFSEYQYVKDGIDNTGDETNPDWVEKAIDWNVPINPAQAGLFSKTFTFGTAQFREDSGRDDVSALDKGFYRAVLPVLNDYTGAMLMERGICGVPRLLMWDGTSPQDDARVLRYPSITPDTFDYNTDWWVKLAYSDGTGTAHDTLYQRLLTIDDPRVSGIRQRPYRVVINATCDLIKGLDLLVTDKLNKTVLVPLAGTTYSGSIEEIEYSVTQNTITISGKI